MHFRDRTDAGKKLAQALSKFRGRQGVVYALPRGGVVLGVEIARALRMPLDLIIPRKIGHPFNPEYAIAAIVESGEKVCNATEVMQVGDEWFQQEIERERQEARRRRELYLGEKKPVAVEGKTAIIVDDGMATGLTMEVALREVKRRRPAQIVIAVPAAPPETVAKLAHEVTEIIMLDDSPYYLGAVGSYYDYFPQVADAEVTALLRSAAAQEQASHAEHH